MRRIENKIDISIQNYAYLIEMHALQQRIDDNSMPFAYNNGQLNKIVPTNSVYFVNLGNGFNFAQMPFIQPLHYSSYQPLNPAFNYPMQIAQNSPLNNLHPFFQPQLYYQQKFNSQRLQNPHNYFTASLSFEEPIRSMTTLPSLSLIDPQNQSSSKKSEIESYLKKPKRIQKRRQKNLTEQECKTADRKCESNLFNHFFYCFNKNNEKCYKTILKLITRIAIDFRLTEIASDFHKDNVLHFFMQILKEFRTLLKKKLNKWDFLNQLCSNSCYFRRYLTQFSVSFTRNARIGQKMVLTFMQLLKRCFIYYLKTSAINSIQTYNRHLNVGFSRYFEKRRNLLNSI